MIVQNKGIRILAVLFLVQNKPKRNSKVNTKRNLSPHLQSAFFQNTTLPLIT
jgi:hypothetical protein